MERKLIVNADDFGYSREVTDGIVHAHRNGIVTSTTLMANMDAWEYAVSLAPQNPALSVGVHLTLTQGRPILPPEQIPSLVDEAGHFQSYPDLVRRAWRFKMDTDEIVEELSAQVRRLEQAGLAISHADSHHHSTMYPQTYAAFLRVLRRHGLGRARSHQCWFYRDRLGNVPRRAVLKKNLRLLPKQIYYLLCDGRMRWFQKVRTPDRRYSFIRLVTDLPFDFSTESWVRFLQNMPPGISELATHPGYRHEHPEDREEMRRQRVRELEFYSDPRVREACDELGVKLVNYYEV